MVGQDLGFTRVALHSVVLMTFKVLETYSCVVKVYEVDLNVH